MAEADLLDPYLLSDDNTKIYLIQPKFTIGRNLENSHVIEDRRISKVHCEFERINDVWHITDKSSNGLIINKQVMTSKQQHILSNRDIIKLPNRCNYVFVDESKSTVVSNSSKSPLESNPSTRNLRPRNVVTYANTSKRRHSTSTNMNVLSENMPGTSKGKAEEEPSVKKRKNANETCEQIDDNLKCVVCTETFIEASRLNCSHAFCKFCIEAWQRKHRTCPICRTDIIEVTSAIELDESIAKFFDSASSEAKQERVKVIEDRQKQEITIYSEDDSNSSYLSSDEERSYSSSSRSSNDENSDESNDASFSGSFSGSNSDIDDYLDDDDLVYSDDDWEDLLLLTFMSSRSGFWF